MNSLYNQADVVEILDRIDRLTPDSPKQWGKMNVAQMLAHCTVSMETATGDNVFRQVFPGKIIAPFMKATVLGKKPFGKNSPTDKSYIFKDNRDLNQEKLRAIASIKKFAEGGPSKCTTHPHPFFGHFTPEQWAVFQWKHLDHHLRQFGA